MPDYHGGKPEVLWGALPTVAQVEELLRATGYSYEAGEYPPDMSDHALAYTDGDGGLLHALSHLKRAMALLGDRTQIVNHRGEVVREIFDKEPRYCGLGPCCMLDGHDGKCTM